MGAGRFRGPFRSVDRLIVAPEAIQQPELVGDDAMVFGWKELFGRRDAIESGLGIAAGASIALIEPAEYRDARLPAR